MLKDDLFSIIKQTAQEGTGLTAKFQKNVSDARRAFPADVSQAHALTKTGPAAGKDGESPALHGSRYISAGAEERPQTEFCLLIRSKTVKGGIFLEIDFDEVVRLVESTRAIITDETLLAEVSAKGRANFVTRCDTAVQNFLQRELRARWPQVQFLGEEAASEPDFSGSVWVLDPVDGTANLMHHFQHSAVSLALVEAGEPVFGVVYQPFLAETFTARRGRGARLNGRPIQVSAGVPAADSVIAVGTSPYDRQLADANFALFRRLFERCGDLRRTGSAALDLAYVAAGRVEGYLERNLKPWDFAAGALLVREAGGRVGDFGGCAPDFSKNCDLIAAGPELWDELLCLAAEE